MYIVYVHHISKTQLTNCNIIILCNVKGNNNIIIIMYKSRKKLGVGWYTQSPYRQHCTYTFKYQALPLISQNIEKPGAVFGQTTNKLIHLYSKCHFITNNYGTLDN